MDKLKKVFSPGSKKDDEVLYGDSEARGASSVDKTPEREPEQLHPVEESGKKEHNILRQIFNPSGHKHDEQAHGTTATTKEPEVGSNKLQTESEAAKKTQDSSDPVALGSSSQTQNLAAADPTAQTMVNDPNFTSQQPSTTGSSMNTYAQPSAQTTGDSHVGRDAAIAGGLVGAGGAGAYAASRNNNEDDKITERPHPLSDRTGQSHINPVTAPSESTAAGGLSDDVSGATYTERSQALGAAGVGATSADYSTTQPHHVGPAGGAHINPVGAPEESLTSPTSDYSGPITGGISTAGASGAAASTQLNSAPDDVVNATFTDRSYPVGAASQEPLDPHIPGEFPAEDGEDIHNVNNPRHEASSVEKDAAALENTTTNDNPTLIESIKSAVGLNKESNTSEAAKPEGEKSSIPIIGAIASAVGLGGLVGGAASKSGPESVEEPAQPSSATSHPGGAGYPIQTTTNTIASAPVEVQGTPVLNTASDTSGGHNYGRDAAVAGGLVGAGAVGYGISESSKDHADTTAAPESLTNPSQQPDPVASTSEPISSTTVPGGSATTTANKNKTLEESRDTGDKSESHYGRDAAVAGGVIGSGAAGYGIYEASKDRADTGISPDTLTRSSQQTHPTTSTGEITSKAYVPESSTTTTAVPTSTATESQKDSEHHYGRDAAVVGGTGAAGYGIYEATKDRNDTGPASKTLGPHESNLANIMDPRVQPEPEKMKESKTVGPHKSDIANKLDPRVQSDPAKADENKNTSRDAAIIGGTGAAGAGALAAADHNDSATTQPPITQEPPMVAAQKSREEDLSKSPSPRTSIDKKSHKSRDEDASEEKEKKPSLLHKLLHPHSSRKSEDKEGRRSLDHSEDNRVSTDDSGHNKLHKKRVEQTHAHEGEGESVVEPHTGLPMNVEKYGSGAGGTDRAPQIEGYKEGGDAKGRDWEGMEKGNTPY